MKLDLTAHDFDTIEEVAAHVPEETTKYMSAAWRSSPTYCVVVSYASYERICAALGLDPEAQHCLRAGKSRDKVKNVVVPDTRPGMEEGGSNLTPSDR